MKILNHLYQSKEQLISFIGSKEIPDSDSVLIQVFGSNATEQELLGARDVIKKLLPSCALIGTTTAGIIGEDALFDSAINVSFSIFEQSVVRSKSYPSLDNDAILKQLSRELITPKTKLLLFFANAFILDSEELLSKLQQKHPTLIVAGGNSADISKFQNCNVFSQMDDKCNAVFATIDSDYLKVQTASLLNWHAIGKEHKVTRAQGTRVYEIDNKPILEVYKHYFGGEIEDKILSLGTQFPLIYKDHEIDIARAPIVVHDDGSLTLAGKLQEGMRVKFGFANVHDIESYNNHQLLKKYPYKMDAVYVYSCLARRSMLKRYLEHEISMIQNIAPTSGFITYGEFFHDTRSQTNTLANITTTIVMLSEKHTDEMITQEPASLKQDEQTLTLKLLTKFVTQVSDELEENLYYLEQFKNAIEQVAIFSTTDAKGIIQEVNQNFIDISGYTREELVGKAHNIIRHLDMPREVFKQMWDTIQSGEIWKGMVKNRHKNGKPYHVLTEITPVYNKDGSFKEYIGVRNDITEIEEYKEILKTKLSTTQKSLDEQVYYAGQYERAVDSTIYILKSDSDNTITYANTTFCSAMQCSLAELIGRNCSEIRHQKHRDNGDCAKLREQLKNKKRVKETLTNIAKDGSEFTIEATIYPIVDMDGNVTEHLHVMNDITQVMELNEEITNTQREVVMTMGAIGETRSQETGEHVKRVAEYSYLLAKLAGLDEEQAMLLKQVSPMHDIGKVGIPDNILNKPGKLTPEEFEVMKTHASLGYEMLKHSKREILKAAAIVANTHHEKWDGSGYPNALKGEDIHIFGRISAIADVFDALGHERVYKKAWKLEKILELFQNERAKHFDPTLVDLFFKHLDRFLEIKDLFKEHVHVNQ